MAKRTPILVHEDGRPFERPELQGYGIEARIAFIRARHAYNDAVASEANRAFSETFSKRLP